MKSIHFLLMLLIICGLNFYVIYRLVYMIPANIVARSIVVIFGIFATLSLFLIFFAGNALSIEITSFLYRIGTSWIFISLYFLMIFLLLDIARVTAIFPVDKILYKNWLSFGVIVGFVTLVMMMGYFKYQNKERVVLDIALNKGANIAPLKIVAVSDLHLGYGIGKEEFSRWVELINKENPDVVLIAGDVIDNSLRPLIAGGYDQVFRNIKSKYGVYMALGNHEYISGVNESLDFLEKSGVKVLRDNATLINNQFYIVGRDDRSYFGRKRIWDLTDPLDQTKPIIVLDHQPYELGEIELFNIDLQISGHTHHGQVWPISWITQAIYQKAHGYLKKGNSHIYVTSGLGVWGGKFRIGTQSEYVVINLSSSN